MEMNISVGKKFQQSWTFKHLLMFLKSFMLLYDVRTDYAEQIMRTDYPAVEMFQSVY